MCRFLLHALLLALGPASGFAVCHADEILLHVAPEGRDTWSGRVSTPTEDGANGPLASLTGARDAIRHLRAEHDGRLPGPVRVQVQPGFYTMETPLRLEPGDSGTEESPIRFEASPGVDPLDAPVISGGVRLKNWSVSGDSWETTVPDSIPSVRHLFCSIDGGRSFVRRYRPTRGAFVIAGLTDSPIKPGANQAHIRSQKDFVFHEGDLGPWVLEPEVEVLALHDWSASRLRVDALDMDRNVITFTDYPRYRIGHWWEGGRNPYVVENVAEDFGTPGEFVFDPHSRRLRYTPTEAERSADPNEATVHLVVPKLEHLMILDGNPDSGSFVEHLEFEGLVFAFTGFELPAEGYTDGQGMTSLPAAIEATGTLRNRWRHCAFEHTGGYAIRLGLGSSHNAIVGCTMHDLGGGGVLIGVTDRHAEPPRLPVGNVVEESWIEGIGRDHFSAHGVWVGIAAETLVRHNRIADGLYSTVSVGWCWDDGPSSVRDNRIEANQIQHAMRLLADGGGIYTLGRQPGTALIGNHIHDIHRSRYAGRAENNGIFFDEGTRDLLVEGNVIHEIADRIIRFNRSQEDWQDFRDNSFGVSPDDPRFPASQAASAGPTRPAWRPKPPVVDPPILALELPDPKTEE